LGQKIGLDGFLEFNGNDKAENKEAGNQLAHMMYLINEEIPEYFSEMKQKYN